MVLPPGDRPARPPNLPSACLSTLPRNPRCCWNGIQLMTFVCCWHASASLPGFIPIPPSLPSRPHPPPFFLCCRAVVISLKKKNVEWWDGLTKDKQYKRFIKTDFAKWCAIYLCRLDVCAQSDNSCCQQHAVHVVHRYPLLSKWGMQQCVRLATNGWPVISTRVFLGAVSATKAGVCAFAGRFAVLASLTTFFGAL